MIRHVDIEFIIDILLELRNLRETNKCLNSENQEMRERMNK